MSGSSIFDYVHPQDHAEIAEQLGLSLSSSQNLASPSSGISEDGSGNQGTNNPDGESSLPILHIHYVCITHSITVHIFIFNFFFFHVDSFISNVNNFANSVQRIRTSILYPNEINANKTRMPFQIVWLSGKHEQFIS